MNVRVCVCVCVQCMCVCARAHACVQFWRLEDNLPEPVLSFHHVGPRHQTQVIGLGSRHLYLPSHLDSPHLGIWKPWCQGSLFPFCCPYFFRYRLPSICSSDQLMYPVSLSRVTFWVSVQPFPYGLEVGPAGILPWEPEGSP